MPVGSGHAAHQTDAVAVRGEVAFAAQLAPVPWVDPRERPPGAGHTGPVDAGSPAPPSGTSSSKGRRRQRPAACQSRGLHPHVMPWPKRNSWAQPSQAMLVNIADTTPLCTARSDSRGRPAPVWLTWGGGRGGSMRCLSPAVDKSLSRHARCGQTTCPKAPICQLLSAVLCATLRHRKPAAGAPLAWPSVIQSCFQIKAWLAVITPFLSCLSLGAL
jgi:hypothetical protein